MNHHAIQRALVRLLYDPRFLAALHNAPESTGLDEETRRTLTAIDPRALRADPHRRLRTLGTLMEEFRISSSLALAETRSRAFLEAFFSSRWFHDSIEQRTPLALAYGAFLDEACTNGTLREVRTRDVVRLEILQARARREAGPVTAKASFSSVKMAPGVYYGLFSGAIFDTIARVEKLLFELSLLPGMALTDDAPRLVLPSPDPNLAPLSLLIVPTNSGLSLVTLDAELDTVMRALENHSSRPRIELIEAVANTLGPERAFALIAELLDDEVLAPA